MTKTFKKKKSLKKTRLLSKDKYEEYIDKKQKKKRLTKKQNQQLVHSLFINYCKCIKKMKKTKIYIFHNLQLILVNYFLLILLIKNYETLLLFVLNYHITLYHTLL